MPPPRNSSSTGWTGASWEKPIEAAAALAKRRPENAQAHFTLGYVQRYAGMLEESTRQCDTALTLAPGNYQFRSCAWAFMELGKFDRARDFIQLDAGSEWANYVTPSLLLREGRMAEAREAVKRMSNAPHYHRDLMEACLGLRPPSELDRMAHDAETSQPSDPDPELSYYQGAIFAYCGKKAAAFHMLKTAIELNYCAYSNLLSDPLLRGLHSDRQFDELLTAAHACQQAVQTPSTPPEPLTQVGLSQLAANSWFPAQSIYIRRGTHRKNLASHPRHLQSHTYEKCWSWISEPRISASHPGEPSECAASSGCQCSLGRDARAAQAARALLCPVLVAWRRRPWPRLPRAAPSPVDPLPPDTGPAGLKQMLLRLQTTARLMQTTAHPDDEDGGMLTLESRGKGVTTLLMTLTRGEGGQNKVGSNLFDVLGVLRALELTASDRYYGVEQRFSRVADFGYSKNPEETFQKWGGHDIPLGDMVRVIRTFRPDVLVARFSGTDRDGHGHHQASAHSDQGSIPRGGRPEAVSRADQGRTATLAGQEALHRQCVRLWGEHLRGGKLHRQAEYRACESPAGHVIHPVRDGRIAAPAFAGRGWLDGGARRSLHLLQAGGFGPAAQPRTKTATKKISSMGSTRVWEP